MKIVLRNHQKIDFSWIILPRVSCCHYVNWLLATPLAMLQMLMENTLHLGMKSTLLFCPCEVGGKGF